MGGADLVDIQSKVQREKAIEEVIDWNWLCEKTSGSQDHHHPQGVRGHNSVQAGILLRGETPPRGNALKQTWTHGVALE